MLLPIALLLIGAFGETWTNTLLPTGVTGHWFADLAANTSFRRAFGVSLMVALACCCAAAVIGLPLAYALHYRSLSGRGMTARLVALLPVGVPALTLGFGYIAIFSGGLPTGVTGHWFADLAANTSFRRAFGVSLMVAL
ncbi:ABC transporter permease, partial [Paraburkholderia sp. GAS32]|uniref:ABC transporter permease n=1 Tax=Paraburkholderia sp. GAS32 TaxID=3035129 RepID=UPI003D1F35C2